jgi:hypothetical protein
MPRMDGSRKKTISNHQMHYSVINLLIDIVDGTLLARVTQSKFCFYNDTQGLCIHVSNHNVAPAKQ